uniref:Uncharacterized protein n=1 Tax=Vitis vinifera TaxID=29760 RepID=F6HF96_VITVI
MICVIDPIASSQSSFLICVKGCVVDQP